MYTVEEVAFAQLSIGAINVHPKRDCSGEVRRQGGLLLVFTHGDGLADGVLKLLQWDSAYDHRLSTPSRPTKLIATSAFSRVAGLAR